MLKKDISKGWKPNALPFHTKTKSEGSEHQHQCEHYLSQTETTVEIIKTLNK